MVAYTSLPLHLVFSPKVLIFPRFLLFTVHDTIRMSQYFTVAIQKFLGISQIEEGSHTWWLRDFSVMRKFSRTTPLSPFAKLHFQDELLGYLIHWDESWTHDNMYASLDLILSSNEIRLGLIFMVSFYLDFVTVVVSISLHVLEDQFQKYKICDGEKIWISLFKEIS